MKRIIISLLFLVLISCSKHGPSIPEGMLSEKDMTGILSDLHLSQLAMNNRIRAEKKDVTASDYLDVILQKHHATKEQFLTSLKFYSENPDLLNDVYDSVIVGLNRKADAK